MSPIALTFNFAQRMLVQYCHSTIFLLGIIGSLINIVLFSKRQLRSNPCCIYFLASSVCALILLSIGIIPQLYGLYNSPNPFTTISSFCKIRSYLNQTSAMSCRWLLVMACIDRCTSCSANVHIRRFSSVKTAKRIVILTIAIWIVYPLHVLIFSDIQSPGNITCSISNNDINLYHRFYTILMGGALPSIIASICSLFIWKHFQQRRNRRAVIIINDINRRKKIQEQHVLIMLIVQITIFVISTIPFMSFNIYDTMTRTITDKSIDRKAIEAFFKSFTELFIYFITMSFYSNTLVSRLFRKELIILFKFIINCGHQQHHRQIAPSNIIITKTNTFHMTTMTKLPMPEINKINI